MIAHLKGLLTILALMALVLLSFRITLSFDSALAMFGAGALVACLFGVTAWTANRYFGAQLSYWSLAVAALIFAVFKQVYPIEYERSLGWAFVIGMLISLLSLAAVLIFRPSGTHERSR